MTHDELLARISKEIQPCGTHTHFECKSKEENLPWHALRAVVELHKPEIPSYCSEDTRCCDDECVICGEGYPCSTIEAIEKELG